MVHSSDRKCKPVSVHPAHCKGGHTAHKHDATTAVNHAVVDDIHDGISEGTANVGFHVVIVVTHCHIVAEVATMPN